jgi:hypothetical protein
MEQNKDIYLGVEKSTPLLYLEPYTEGIRSINSPYEYKYIE